MDFLTEAVFEDVQVLDVLCPNSPDLEFDSRRFWEPAEIPHSGENGGDPVTPP